MNAFRNVCENDLMDIYCLVSGRVVTRCQLADFRAFASGPFADELALGAGLWQGVPGDGQ